MSMIHFYPWRNVLWWNIKFISINIMASLWSLIVFIVALMFYSFQIWTFLVSSLSPSIIPTIPPASVSNTIVYPVPAYSALLLFRLSGHRSNFLLPDRSKYVNMEKRFLKSYMDLLVQTCHRRGALATGGMAALLLPPDRDSALCSTVLQTVARWFGGPSARHISWEN